MTLSISHQAIAQQVKACVALENLMHPDMKCAPVITANGEALKAAIRGALSEIVTTLGNRATEVSQTESQTVITTAGEDMSLRVHLEQATVALLLRQCFSTVAPGLAAHYGERYSILSGLIASAGSSGARIRPDF